jgi:restriction system protein
LAWLALAICWVGAAASYLKSKQRKRLLRTQSGLDSIRALSWQEFEMLVGEAFRCRGYTVEETGLRGADGGVDLILRKDGRTELVQCKQWRNRQVKPAVVREMWGLKDHHNADAIKIVCVGEYTRDAEAFAEGKAIELINGERLVALVRDGQSATERAIATDGPTSQDVQVDTACPRCGEAMMRRVNRQTGQPFWGCSTYPRCKATRPA